MKKRIKTVYGVKRPGTSRFIVVAPHAGGDDLCSSTVAHLLFKSLKAYLVVNKNFYKARNHNAKVNPEQVEDFNQLRWSFKKERYLWARKHPAMKQFYQDIGEYCDLIRRDHNDKKAVIIYIHSMDNAKIGLDLGVGLRAPRNNYRFIRALKENQGNSGQTTIKISYLKKLQTVLQEKIKKEYNLEVTIGHKHAGWSKSSANQFHKHAGRNDYAIQLEINQVLRQKTNRVLLINVLTQAFQTVFN